MTAKPVEAVAEDAAALLGDAVARVTAEALNPKLDPFTEELASVTKQLLERAGELGDIAAEQDDALRELNNHFANVRDAADKQLEAAARQQAAIDEATRTVREIGGELTSVTRDAAVRQAGAAARQQAAVDETVRVIGQIGGDLSSTTRDLTGLTQQLTRFRRMLAVSIAIGALALAAGAAALVLALG